MKKLLSILFVLALIFSATPAAYAGCGACGGGEGHTHEEAEKMACENCDDGTCDDCVATAEEATEEAHEHAEGEEHSH